MAISPRLYGLSGQDLGGGIGMDQAFDLIVRLFEEPEHWLKMQKERDESLHENSSTASTGESSQWRQDYSASNEAVDYF
uniref:Uncharacterized protein n=1 Tax=Fagus sylvatica TaxID=28930 RepID=A0A2N9F4E2_FAGSY